MKLAEFRAYLQQKHLTQTDIADYVGVEQQSVSLWLRGKRMPREAHQRAIAAFLQVSLTDLQAMTGWRSRTPHRQRPSKPPASPTHQPMITRTDLVDQAVAWLTAHPPPHQMITLLGPPGIGKTYLAAVIAEAVATRFDASRVLTVKFVAMPDDDHTGRVSRELLTGLNLGDVTGHDALTQITSAINRETTPFLLVLDAFEWVIGARPLLIELLRRCRHLRLLVTSTEVLHVGDQHLSVPALSYPHVPARLLRSQRAQPAILRQTAAFLGPAVDWDQYDAIQLFIERGRAVRPDLLVDAATLPAIALICQQVQGIPLLLEVVAGGARFTNDPRHLLADLGQFQRTLTSDDQLLHTTIGRFYTRLPTTDQALLRRLSVIPGAFNLTTAATCLQAISASEGSARPATWGVAGITRSILRLVDANLITATGSDGTSYRLLDGIRTFALNELYETGEALSVMPAFVTWLLVLARQGERTFGAARGNEALTLLDQLTESVRSALSWSFGEALTTLGLPLAGSLWWYWDTRALYAEGSSWLAQAEQHCLAEGIALPATIAYGIGVMAYRQGKTEKAAAALQHALDSFVASDDQFGERWATAYLGLVAEQQRDYVQAATLHQRCTILARTAGDQFVEAGSLGNEAEVAIARDDLAAAAAHIAAALPVATAIESAVVLGRLWHVQGRLALRQNNIAGADEAFRLALDYASQIEDQRFIAVALEGLGTMHALSAEPEVAMQLFGAAAVLREEAGSPRLAQHAAEYERGMQFVQDTLDEARHRHHWERGQQLALHALQSIVWRVGWSDQTMPILALLTRLLPK